MIWVRVKYLPDDSACRTLQRDGLPFWGVEQILLAHVWQAAAQSKEPHPMLAAAMREHRRRAPTDPERAKKRAAARARARERRRAIDAGEIT